MNLTKTPWLVKKLYPNLIWNMSPESRCIYLTFDDGPIPIVTPFVLNILKLYDAKATFFCIGDNVSKHPEVFEQLKNEGHAVGSHTYNHLNGWDTDDETYLDNFIQADKLTNTNLFRPPYGRIKKSQIKQLKAIKPGLDIIMWSILSRDYDQTLDPENCLENVLKNTKTGDIVLFHDSLKAKERMEYALPRALEYWSGEGYEFEALI